MTETLFLVARIAGRGIAIDVAQVDSVVDVGVVVPVPRSDPAVRGLTALRSRVVTVIDTWAMLGLAAPAHAADRPAERAIITRIADYDYAILVDALDDVAPFIASALPPGLALDGGWARAARGVVDDARGPMLVIDLTALVPTLAACD